jgi:hypothetical protein
MTTKYRFGRKLALPSTRALVHELKTLIASEDARMACAAAIGISKESSWEEIRAARLASEAASSSANSH